MGPRLSIRVRLFTREGRAAAYAEPTMPPSECPTRCTSLSLSSSRVASTSSR